MAFAEILFLLLHGHCGFTGLFLEDTRQVDNYRDWHEVNHGNLKTMESHHRNNAFVKVSSLSLNLEVSLAQVSHIPEILGKYLKPNLECITQNKSYARNEVGFNQYDKLFLYTKHEKILNRQKYDKYSEHIKAFSRKSQLIKHWKTQMAERHCSCTDCGKASSQKPDLIKHQRAHTRRNPTGAAGVRKLSAGSPISFYTREPTQERSPMSATNVGKLLLIVMP